MPSIEAHKIKFAMLCQEKNPRIFLELDFCFVLERHSIISHFSFLRLGGGIGRHKGLKIPCTKRACGFDSRPRHQ